MVRYVGDLPQNIYQQFMICMLQGFSVTSPSIV